MFQGIYAVDPCMLNDHHGSAPLTHIHSFEDLCQILIFPYIIIKNEVYNGVTKINIDFKDIPNALFEESLKVNFFRKEGEDEGQDID